MLHRQTRILLIALGVVLVAAYFIQYWNASHPAEPSPTVQVGYLVSFDESQIAIVRIADQQGNRVVIGRDELGLWQVREPAGGQTDLASAEMGISQLMNLRVVTTLEQSSELVVFGLAEPIYTIEVVLNGGVKHTIRVGDLTPTRSGYYVQLNGGVPQVVSQSSLDSVVSLLQDPPLLPTPTVAVTDTLTIEPTLVITGTVAP